MDVESAVRRLDGQRELCVGSAQELERSLPAADTDLGQCGFKRVDSGAVPG